MTRAADIEIFFDGACPLCRREVAALRGRDTRQRVRFTDIAAADFDAAAFGKTQTELMAKIHGRLGDGTWISGMEVFRRVYAAVGLRWLAAVTRAPGLSQLLDGAYAIFARNRLRITGRCSDQSCRTA
ncbi:MAG: DUF393 domain-containing protein [Proteobacteria bacterium]|nr:DUF393 domain-containing protein [Pseudomonadota bacterium]